jgi:pyrimidine-nucleoside phosphorylase
MTFRDLIECKRDGGEISVDAWHQFTRDLAAGTLADYQVSALLMAIYFRGLTERETTALMEGMLASGRSLELRHLPVGRVDKHSTGGVGDKVSIALAPIVAVCGVAVPMMSGRGLGHTGGTLDKLESIPGFRTRIPLAEATRQLEQLNCALMGQSGEIAPADRILYALRDATATVESIPLISASIMSKKMAESLTGLVLDVKTGAGSFMPKLEDALTLAHTMIAIGARHAVPVVALLTNMDAPLGEACGNANEVAESIDLLKGGGPADLRALTLRTAAEMLVLGGTDATLEGAMLRARGAVESGAALQRFREIIAAQGGDPRVCDDPAAILPQPALRIPFVAERDGIVQRVEPRIVGKGISAMGGGRNTMADTIDASVGFRITARPGDAVRVGETLAMIEARDALCAEAGRAALAAAVVIGPGAVVPRPLISHRVTTSGVERVA